MVSDEMGAQALDDTAPDASGLLPPGPAWGSTSPSADAAGHSQACVTRKQRSPARRGFCRPFWRGRLRHDPPLQGPCQLSRRREAKHEAQGRPGACA